MTKSAIAVAALGFLLAACGGGGGGSSDPQPAAKPAPKVITIDAEGDSTMFGLQTVNGVAMQTPNNAPAELQTDLRNGGMNVSIQNNGVSGADAQSSLDAIAPFYSTPFSTRLSSNAAQIVLSNYAINDSRKRTTDQYMADLGQWIDTVRAAGKLAILEEPNPTCGGADGYAPNLDAYVTALRVVAQQKGVLLIEQYDYIKSLSNWQSMLTDCVHPNDALYKIKADREATALTPILKGMM